MTRTIMIIGALAVVSSAFTQVSKPTGLSVRLGLFMPSSSIGRNEGNSWFGGGVDWKIKEGMMGNSGASGTYSVSADWFGKGSLSTVPVMLNFTSHNKESYWSVGAGVALTRDYVVVGAVRNSRNKTNFGYTAALGWEFQKGSNPLFVEGRYFGNSNSNLSGFGVFVGIHM